ncbi:MAG TPA: hypothetical protein VJ233_03065 [Hyphomicrobiaceae bacterium]|nr:hypothetical protein [Hyphomicrobiaceae bacterium]
MAKALLPLFALSLLAAPVEYLAHEGAHYLAARLFGANATLHFDRVSLGGARLGPWQSLAFTAAGPLADWVVGIAALLLLVRRYTLLRLVFAIWLARPLQFLPALLGIDLPSVGSGADLRFTDEALLARAVGLSPEAFIWLETAVAAPLLAEIVLLMPPPRLAVLATLALGVFTGWAGWLIFGQYVLP